MANSKNQEKHDKASKKKEEKVHISGLKGGQRVKVVGSDAIEEIKVQEEAMSNTPKKVVEKIRSKKYKEAKAKFDHSKTFSANEAIKIVKESSYSKFDGTMELHLVLKKAGVSVQVALPHQAGKVKKVEVANEETLEKLKVGKVDYDVLLATPEYMAKLVPFAKILGPRGLMPNPKNGTLISDAKKAKDFSASSITLKTEKEAPLIHTVVGKASQENKELEENIKAVIKALGGATQIVKVYLKSTMSPSVKVTV